jgi:hypothetical protein
MARKGPETCGHSVPIEQHIATMARLHRADRYNRGTNEVEQVTGQPAQTVEQYIADHLDRFAR